MFPLSILIYFSPRQITKRRGSITGRTQFYAAQWADMQEKDAKRSSKEMMGLTLMLVARQASCEEKWLACKGACNVTGGSNIYQ